MYVYIYIYIYIYININIYIYVIKRFIGVRGGQGGGQFSD